MTLQFYFGVMLLVAISDRSLLIKICLVQNVGKSSSQLCNAKILSEEFHALSIWKNQFLDAITVLFTDVVLFFFI